MSCDAVGQKATPIELLVLGSLRYLGCGWTFDDVEECTAVSQEVHRVFFGQFIEFAGTVLYNKYVVYPKNFEEAKEHMKEFTVAGLPGALDQHIQHTSHHGNVNIICVTITWAGNRRPQLARTI